MNATLPLIWQNNIIDSTRSPHAKRGTAINILFLAPRIPYPLDNGAKIRTFHLLKAVSAHHRVILLTFLWDEKERPYIDKLQKLVFKIIAVPALPQTVSHKIQTAWKSFITSKPFIILKYASALMHKKVKEVIAEEEISVIHCDHLHMAQYAPHNDKDIITVLDEHNVESIIWERLSESVKNPLIKLFYYVQTKLMLAYEKFETTRFTVCFTVSEEDKKNLLSISPGATARVIPNGVDTGYFTVPDKPSNDRTVIFTGSMNWFANEDAMLYFIQDIFPKIQHEFSDSSVYIVGQNPSKKLSNLLRPGVKVTGRVEDIRAYMKKSTVYIVPLRIGGGTRLKILEAMALGMPVVSTSIGCEGIAAESGKDIFIADTAREFSDAVIRLFADPSRRRELGSNGRRLVEARYRWEQIGADVEKIYQQIGRRI